MFQPQPFGAVRGQQYHGPKFSVRDASRPTVLPVREVKRAEAVRILRDGVR